MSLAVEVEQPTLRISAFQKAVLDVPEDYDLALLGGRGGGKSWALALLFLRHELQYGADAKGLYLRSTHQATRDFRAVTREVFGLAYGKAARINESSGIWKLPHGGTLEINQIEADADYAKFQGRSYSMIAADEAQLHQDLARVEALRSNLRGPEGVPTRFVLAANPGGPSHSDLTSRFVNTDAGDWEPFLEEASGRTWVRCTSTFADNPFQSLDYEQQLLASTAHDPGKRRAWLNGDWCAMAAGAFFADVLDDKNKLDPFPHDFFERPNWPRDVDPTLASATRGWQTFLAMDWGSSAPCVVYLMAVAPGGEGPGGEWLARDSLVGIAELHTALPGRWTEGRGLSVPDVAELIHDMCDRWSVRPQGCADDAIFAKLGSGAGSIADEFRAHGVQFYPSGKGDRIGGWQTMKRLLADAGKLGRPGLYLSRTCQGAWATLPALEHDAHRVEDVASKSRIDHWADSLRYACVWSGGPSVGTQEIRL